MIKFDIVIPHSILNSMSSDDLLWNYVLKDIRVERISDDREMGLCDAEIRIRTDILDLRTVYTIMAEYYDPELEMLRKLML